MVCRRRVSFCRSTATLLALAALAPLSAQAAVTTYTGTFSGPIAAGDTALLNDGASVSGNVANSGTLQFNMSGTSAVADNAVISGTGVVRMTGSGTVSNLFDAQTYTGATRLENGTLLINYNDRLGNTSSGVTFDGGRLQITNSGVVATFSTARSMSLVSAGTIDTATLANGSYDQPAFTGVVSGTGTLTLAAHGLGDGASDAYLRFGGASTYTGTTRITSGMVYASSTAGFGTSTVVLDGGGLVAPAAVTANNAIVLAGTANSVRPWGSQTMNLGGAISGTGGLQKTDNGTVNLNSANSYTGDTRIVAGTLNAGNYAALASTTLDMRAGDAGSIGFTVAQTGTYQIAGLTGSRAINNGGDTLAIGSNDASTTYAGNLSGGGGLTKTGAGTLTLSAGNSFTGDTRISTGTLAIENTNALQSSTLDMNSGDSGAITFSQVSNIGGLTGSRGLDNGGYTLTIGGNDGNYSYAGTLSGTGGLIKNGSGSLGLTGSNSFRGDTRISAGTLVIANTNALANSMLDMSSGDSGVITFALASNIGGLKGSRAINNGGNTLTIGGLVTSSTYSGALSGGGALIKSGADTLTLTGNNSYTGGTVLQGGTLAVGSANAMGSSGTISFTGGTLRYSAVGFPVDYSARLSSAAGQLYAIDTNGRDVSFATPLNSLGGSLTKLGEGKLTLPDSDVGVVGVENMSVVLVSGTLAGASGSSSLFIPGGQVLNVSGGVLGRVNNFDAVTIDRVVIGSSDVPSQPIATGTISGGLVYVNGIEVGSSQSGTSAGGSLTVNGGVVKTKVSVGMASGTSASMLLTGGTVGDAESNHIVGVSGVGSLTMTGGSLVGRNVSLGTAAGSQGDVIMSGGTVSPSTLVVGVSGTGVLNVSGGEVNTSLTVGQSLGSTGTVAISGGVVRARITAGNSYGSTGTVVISGGTVGGSGTSQNWDHAIGGDGTGSLAMTGGSLIGRQLNLGSGVGAGTAGISGGTTTVDTLTVGSSGSGDMTLTNGRVDTRSTVIARAETSFGSMRRGAVTVSGGTLTANETMSVGGFMATGTLSVADAGVVNVAGGTGTIDVGNIFGPSVVNIGTGAAAGTLAVGQVNGNGAFGAGATLNFSHTGTTTFAPAIVGTMNVTKLGTGTTILTGSNTYAGFTWVREGTLVVGAANAFSAASTLTLDSAASFDRAGFSQTVTNAAINGSLANTGGGGLLTVTGTLSGSGVVNGNVSVAGVHSPGNSPGTQTFSGDLTYAAGAAVNWELVANTTGSAGTLSDQIVLPTGNLLFSGSTAMNLSFNGAGSTVTWSDPFWAVDRAWLVYDLSAGTTTGIGNFSVTATDWLDANAAALSSARPGSTFSVGLTGQDVVLNYVTAVPEPGSLAVLFAGGAIGLGLRLGKGRRGDRTTAIR